MRLLPPIPWHLVTPGMVVLFAGTPYTVLWTVPDHLGATIYVEGMGPMRANIAPKIDDIVYAQPVELDEADAVGNLFAAGLNPTPIEGMS